MSGTSAAKINRPEIGQHEEEDHRNPPRTHGLQVLLLLIAVTSTYKFFLLHCTEPSTSTKPYSSIISLTMPVSHICLTVSHLPTSCSFYLAALSPLGYNYIGQQDNQVGFGIVQADFFISQAPAGYEYLIDTV